MGIAYRNTPTASVAVWAGVVTEEETEHHLRKLAADPEWASQGRILTDLTFLAEESRPSDERIDHTAQIFRLNLSQRTSKVKWAMVADRTFEEATKFSESLVAEAPRLIVFTERAAACEWLGVDYNEIRPILEDLTRVAEQPG
jgi:hypothetical protein